MEEIDAKERADRTVYNFTAIDEELWFELLHGHTAKLAEYTINYCYLNETCLRSIDDWTMQTYDVYIRSLDQGRFKADYVPWAFAVRVFREIFPFIIMPSMNESLHSRHNGEETLFWFEYKFRLCYNGQIYTVNTNYPYPVMEQYGNHAGLINPDPKQLVTSYLRGLVKAIALAFGVFRSLYIEDADLEVPGLVGDKEKGKAKSEPKSKLPNRSSRKAKAVEEEEDEDYDDFEDDFDDDDEEEEEEPAPKPKRASSRSRGGKRTVEVDL